MVETRLFSGRYLVFFMALGLCLGLRIFSSSSRGFLYESEARAALCAESWFKGRPINGAEAQEIKPGASGGPIHELSLIPAIFLNGRDMETMHLLNSCYGATIVGILSILANRWSGSQAATITCIVLAFSPSLVAWSAGAMPHSLALLLSIISLVLMTSLWTIRIQFLSGLIFVGAVACHGLALFFIPGLLTVAIARLGKGIIPFFVFFAGLLAGIFAIDFICVLLGGGWIQSWYQLVPDIDVFATAGKSGWLAFLSENRGSLGEFPAYLVHTDGAPVAFLVFLGGIGLFIRALREKKLSMLAAGITVFSAWFLPALFGDTRPGNSALALTLGLVGGMCIMVDMLGFIAKKSPQWANISLIILLIFTFIFSWPAIYELATIKSNYAKAFSTANQLKGDLFSTAPLLGRFHSGRHFSRVNLSHMPKGEIGLFVDWRSKASPKGTLKIYATVPNPAGTSLYGICEDPLFAVPDSWTRAYRTVVRPGAGEIMIYHSLF